MSGVSGRDLWRMSGRQVSTPFDLGSKRCLEGWRVRAERGPGGMEGQKGTKVRRKELGYGSRGRAWNSTAEWEHVAEWGRGQARNPGVGGWKAGLSWEGPDFVQKVNLKPCSLRRERCCPWPAGHRSKGM